MPDETEYRAIQQSGVKRDALAELGIFCYLPARHPCERVKISNIRAEQDIISRVGINTNNVKGKGTCRFQNNIGTCNGSIKTILFNQIFKIELR